MAPSMTFLQVELSSLTASPRNARVHPKAQIASLCHAMRVFGVTNPLLIDEAHAIIGGHARALAAAEIGLKVVPAIRIDGLTIVQKKQLAISDNALALRSKWDRETLAKELNELIVMEADLTLTGLEAPEIDAVLIDLSDSETDPADDLTPTEANEPVVSKSGDVWHAGPHRIACGDARLLADVERLCGSAVPSMVFTDPPYNLRIAGLVGRGQAKYREFEMASGEMSPDEFLSFLTLCLGNAAKVSRNGSVHQICMDWRHMDQLLAAGKPIYSELVNIAVWVKSNAGQGSYLRSQHEMIAIFQAGAGARTNNVELGRHGRNRSNVWHYPGASSFGARGTEVGVHHPTIKPVALIADAMRDCTRRGEVVLDVFAGVGSTLMAAERVGRRGLMLEIDPIYVDQIVTRWQRHTGRDAIHATSGISFNELLAEARQTHSSSEGVSL